MPFYEHLGHELIYEVAETALNSPYSVCVVLTDGSLLLGDVGPKYSPLWMGAYGCLKDEFFTKAERERSYPAIVRGHLILSADNDGGLLIAIPLESISGIFQIPQLMRIKGTLPEIEAKSIRALKSSTRTVVTAKQHGFRITLFVVYCLAGGVVGDIQLDGDLPLYADWQYLRIRSGGIDAIGIGLFGFGGSAGWKESVLSRLRAYVGGSPSPLADALAGARSKERATIEGKLLFPKREEFRHMDGRKWLCCVLTDQPSTPDERAGKDLLLRPGASALPAYVDKRLFLYPFEDFPLTSSSYRVAGELIPYSLKVNDNKEFDRFRKVRAVYHIRDESECLG